MERISLVTRKVIIGIACSVQSALTDYDSDHRAEKVKPNRNARLFGLKHIETKMKGGLSAHLNIFLCT